MSQNGDKLSGTGREFEAARREMVVRQIHDRGIVSPRVLKAMQAVPRHEFVLPEHLQDAYADKPLPIGEGQTISQPFMVAAMTDALLLEGAELVLEIGSGSGYQTAVLSMLAREVIAIEAQPALASQARARLERLGYSNVRIEEGDGSSGWPACAPYDAILVAAAAPRIPPPLAEQLAEGGRLVIPVGGADDQELVRVVQRDGRTNRETLYNCRFVPLIGRYGWQRNASPEEKNPHANE